jgi:hypothetical protein
MLGIKDKSEVGDLDIRNYMKFILKEGSVSEKRDLLTCLRSKIALKEKQIFLTE